MTGTPRFTTSTAFDTLWFKVLERTPEEGGHPYFAVQPRDYVSVLAVTDDDRLVLVRQFRPVIEAWTLELPSGTVDGEESPEAAMRRELREETGFRARELTSLGVLQPDTGRLSNRLYAFFARVEVDPERLAPEADEWSIEVVTMDRPEFVAAHLSGAFAQSLQCAVLHMAHVKGVWSLV